MSNDFEADGTNRPAMRRITSEKDLFFWLTDYTRQTSTPQLYPKAIARFVDDFLEEAVDGLDLGYFLQEYSPSCSVLSEVFHRCRHPEQQLCHPAFVDFAGRYYEQMNADGFIDLEHGNRILIKVLGLGATVGSGLFTQRKKKGLWYLRGTPTLETRFQLKVTIKQNLFYFGYV